MSIARAFNNQGGTSEGGGGDASGTQKTQDFSAELNGTKTSFVISESFTTNSIRVYYNGIRQSGSAVTETANGFTISFDAPLAGESLIADYNQTS